MALGTALPYGLRDVKLVPYPNLEALSFGSTLVDLPNARTFSFTDAEEYTDLRGDDKLVTSHGQGSQVEWELESGGVSIPAYAILAGGEMVETGIAPNQRRRFRKYATSQRPFFTALGQSISDAGGDFHGIVYLCRSTGNIEGEFADGEFFIPSASGIGFPCRVAGNVAGLEIQDAIYDFVQNEAITALTAPSLDAPGVPAVYSMSDQTSVTAGGEIVVVSGERFVGVTTVTVGGTNVTDFEVQSPYKIVLITPPKTAGPYQVVVTNATGPSTTGAQTTITYA